MVGAKPDGKVFGREGHGRCGPDSMRGSGVQDMGGFRVYNWKKSSEVLGKRMEVDLGWSRFGTRAWGTGVLHWESGGAAGLGRWAPSAKGLGTVGCEALRDTGVVVTTNSLLLGIFNGDAGLGVGTVLPSTFSPCCLPCPTHGQNVWTQAPESAFRLELCYFNIQAFVWL